MDYVPHDGAGIPTYLSSIAFILEFLARLGSITLFLITYLAIGWKLLDFLYSHDLPHNPLINLGDQEDFHVQVHAYYEPEPPQFYEAIIYHAPIEAGDAA